MTVKELFLNFLSDNGVLLKFKENLLINKDIDLDTHIEKNIAEDYIYNAFEFINTPEGFEYWYDLHNKWINTYLDWVQTINSGSNEEEKESQDFVSNPKHYKSKHPEPIEVILAWGLDFLEGNVIKYLARWREKNGITDLKKAQWYLNKLIETEEQKEGK